MSQLAKLERVARLIDKLCKDQKNETLTVEERRDALLQLKLEGRDPSGAEVIFGTTSISMLLKYAFESDDIETSRGAQRVVANAMVLRPEARRTVLEQGSPEKFCKLLERKEWDDEFLASRILLILTYANINVTNLVEKLHIIDLIVEHLARHTSQLSKKAPPEPMQDMALVETLKLLFNITHYYTSNNAMTMLAPALPHLIALLWKEDIPKNRPLDGPYGQVVNALLNLDLRFPEVEDIFYPPDNPTKVVARLVELLDPAIRTYEDQDLEAVVTPLVQLVWNSETFAPRAVKDFLRKALLPTAQDHEQVLGRGETLSAKLLSNFSSPLCPTLRESISNLFFELSDRDASKFVENVGYGLASGYLFQHNIPVPAPAAADSDVQGESSQQSERPINPVTGQFLDAEKKVDLPEMTDDEKQREAERLFVLFERLRATGVMDVQNPVEAAMRLGEFRELDEDEVEELD